MFTNSFEDSKVLIVCEYLVLLCVLILVIPYNQEFASMISTKLNIPYDLTLTITSAGFGNNIIILSTIAEIVLVVLFIEKLIPAFVRRIVWGC